MQQTRMDEEVETMAQSMLLSADTLSGAEVKTPQGERVGTIREVMVDVEHGRVAYVAISFDAFSELDEKLFAIPWEALRLDTQDETFILDIAKKKLETAPGLENQNRRHTSSSQQWLAAIYHHFEYTPYWSW